MAERQHRPNPMVGDALEGISRHAPQQVRAKRDIGFEGKPEPRPVDAAIDDVRDEIAPVGTSAPTPADRRGKGENFTQREIDLVRTRVMNSMAAHEVKQCMLHYERTRKVKYPDLTEVFHLWFPEPNTNRYELRHGNPPPDDPRDRPKHLVGKDLVMDFDQVDTGHWVKITMRLDKLMRSKYKASVRWMDAVLRGGQKETAIIPAHMLPRK